jgi:hypothetical protein
MSREGILKYLSLLLLPLEGPEFYLHNRSIPIVIFNKKIFYLNFQLLVSFFCFSSENTIPVI